MGGSELILLDTHIWIWSNLQPSAIPSRIRGLLETGEEPVAISVVSIWETLVAAQKGRVVLLPNAIDGVRNWIANNPIEVVPIDTEIAILSRSLLFAHEDPADRFIAATAFRFGYELATVDEDLARLTWLKLC